MNISEAEKNARNEKMADALEDAYTDLYYGERLLMTLRNNFFNKSEDRFPENNTEAFAFANNYEDIAAILFSICELLYNARLKCEFGIGIDTKITTAHKEITKKMWGETA